MRFIRDTHIKRHTEREERALACTAIKNRTPRFRILISLLIRRNERRLQTAAESEGGSGGDSGGGDGDGENDCSQWKEWENHPSSWGPASGWFNREVLPSPPNETKRDDERAFPRAQFFRDNFSESAATIVHLGERFLREGATYPRRMSMRACVRATSSLAHVETPLRWPRTNNRQRSYERKSERANEWASTQTQNMYIYIYIYVHTGCSFEKFPAEYLLKYIYVTYFEDLFDILTA